MTGKGKVNRIFETINAAHILMDAKEAERLSHHKWVKRVDQDVLFSFASVQNNAGWGLGRIDQARPSFSGGGPDQAYNYINTGAGKTVYVLDSGLALGNTNVAAEFGWPVGQGQTWAAVQDGTGRAFNYYDFSYFGGSLCGLATANSTGYCGEDILGHGTQVASIIGGTIAGVAKGVKILMIKVGSNFPPSNWLSNAIAALNFLSTGGTPRGTIVNMSLVIGDPGCTLPENQRIIPAWESAVTAAYNAGLIIVTAAGNDGCNTANYSPTRIPQAFVVGATSSVKFANGKDARAQWTDPTSESRKGTNISVFAPSADVKYISKDGNFYYNGKGTSLATAYVSGTFALACQAGGSFCNTAATGDIYQAMRNNTVNTATDSNGLPFTDGTTSRFIQQKW